MVFGTVAAFVCAFAVADAGYLHIQCCLLHIILKNIGRKEMFEREARVLECVMADGLFD